MIGPVIPGLNDSEIPAIMSAAREAGAIGASYVLLKLPTTVKDVFQDWLRRTLPDKMERVEGAIRSTRAGRLSDSQFGRRQRGTGNIAKLIAGTFELWHKKLGFAHQGQPLNCNSFCAENISWAALPVLMLATCIWISRTELRCCESLGCTSGEEFAPLRPRFSPDIIKVSPFS